MCGVTTGAGTVGVPGIGGMWTPIPLSFVPTALNDAGVIVGNHATLGPVRFENGVMTVLPPQSGVNGPFAAVDVASNGAIVGSTKDLSSQEPSGYPEAFSFRSAPRRSASLSRKR